jgi:ABC-type transport system involved in multi-copper enzyme maturation permease subunit
MMLLELVRQEAVKLFSQRFVYVLLTLVLLSQTGRMIGLALTPTETALDVLTPPQLWAEGASLGLRFASYVVLILGAMGFSQEFALGTVKTMLVLPLQRWQWALAKQLFLCAIGAGLVLLVVLLSTVLTAVTTGMGGVVREGLELYAPGAVWGAMAVATMLTIVLVLPLCAMALLIGLYFTASGAAVGVAIVLGIVLEIAANLLPWHQAFFLSHLYAPFGLVLRMGRGMPFQWETLLTWGIGSSLVSLAILCGWIIIKLQRMDVTA